MSLAVIRVENLNFYYKNQPILKNINLEVNQGDFLALIGPNGGGKSTLIRCILGFIKFQEGRVWLWNQKNSEFKEWFKIGYVPQRAGNFIDHLNPLTVREFIFLPAQWYSKEVQPKRFELLVKKFGMENLLGHKVGELSYGQLQRAYIIRALILEPELLILDEPSVGLDFFTQEIFYQTLGEFHQRGLTIILVTHETWLLTKWVNKVACLNQRLFFHGDHESFCIFAKKSEFFSACHQIEHTHW